MIEDRICIKSDLLRTIGKLSNIRKKFSIPNMLQFKNSLKILCVFQYLHLLENANYE